MFELEWSSDFLRSFFSNDESGYRNRTQSELQHNNDLEKRSVVHRSTV